MLPVDPRINMLNAYKSQYKWKLKSDDTITPLTWHRSDAESSRPAPTTPTGSGPPVVHKETKVEEQFTMTDDAAAADITREREALLARLEHLHEQNRKTEKEVADAKTSLANVVAERDGVLAQIKAAQEDTSSSFNTSRFVASAHRNC